MDQEDRPTPSQLAVVFDAGYDFAKRASEQAKVEGGHQFTARRIAACMSSTSSWSLSLRATTTAPTDRSRISRTSSGRSCRSRETCAGGSSPSSQPNEVGHQGRAPRRNVAIFWTFNRRHVRGVEVDRATHGKALSRLSGQGREAGRRREKEGNGRGKKRERTWNPPRRQNCRGIGLATGGRWGILDFVNIGIDPASALVRGAGICFDVIARLRLEARRYAVSGTKRREPILTVVIFPSLSSR